MFTSSQLVAHAVGDYVLQSQWMADHKAKRSLIALLHATAYMLPFLLLTRSPLALLMMWGSHFLIDRFRLARYVCWVKNGPWHPLTTTGYPDHVPPWMAAWLMIAADNILHILINGVALWWL